MIRAILFDFNGVLVDDEPLHFELLQKVLRQEDIELTREDYYANYLGLDDRTCFHQALQRANTSASLDRISRLIARKSAFYHTRVHRQGFPIFAGARELILQAKDRDLRLGVVSGALLDEVEGALEQLGVRDSFTCIVTAEDVTESKPAPEGYQKGLQLLNALPPLPARLFHPHEVLAIEDSKAGLKAAAATGMATLGVAQTYPAEELHEADQIVDKLDGLTVEHLLTLFSETA